MKKSHQPPMNPGRLYHLLLLLALALSAVPALADDAEETFNLANGVFIVGDYETALEYYDDVLDKFPKFKDRAEAEFRKAECLFKLKRYPKAAETYASQLEHFPDFKEATTVQYRLSEIFFTNLKDYAKAVKYSAALLARAPRHKLADSALYIQAESLFKLKRYPEAIQVYRKLEADFPGSDYAAPSLFSIGYSYFLQKDYGKAAETFKTQVQRFPKSDLVTESRFKLAESLFHLKQYAAAKDVYTQLLDGKGAEFEDDAAIGAGRCLFELGKKKEAAEAFLDAAKKFSGLETGQVARFNAGSSLFALGKYAEALEAFEQLIAAKPARQELAENTRYWKARCLLKLKKHDAALKELVALQQQQPKALAAEVLFSIGDAHYAAGKFAKALQQYQAVVTAFPGHYLADDAVYSQCLCLQKLGNLAQGIEKTRAFLEKYPQSDKALQVRFLQGEFQYLQGDYASAGPNYQKVFLAGGELADDALYKLAWTQRLARKTAETEKAFRLLASRFPKSPFVPEAQFLVAKITAEKGDHDAALKLFDTVAKSFPKSPFAARAKFEAALELYQRNQFPAAAARFNSYLKQFPMGESANQAILNLSECYFETGKIADARTGYTRVLKLTQEPSLAAPARYGLAWCLRKTQKLEAAALEFERMVKDFPKDSLAPESLYWAGYCLEEAGQFDLARQRYLKITGAYADSTFAVEADYRAGACLLRLDKFAEALKALRQHLASHPSSAFAAQAGYDIAWCYRGLKQTDAEKKAYQAVVSQFPESDIAAEALFALGELAYRAKNFAEAETQYRACIARNKASILDRALYKLAWALSEQKRLPDARAAFEKLLSAAPKSQFAAEAQYRIGRIDQAEGKFGASIPQFQKSLQLLPDEKLKSAAVFQLAESYRHLKEWSKALENYNTAIAAGEKTAIYNEALYGKGLCSLEVGATQDAIDAFKKVVSRTKSVIAARAQLGLGEVYFRQKDFDRAAKQFLKVHLLYGYEEWKPTALFMAAQSFEKAGKAARAKTYYDLLLKDFPKSDYAAKVPKQ